MSEEEYNDTVADLSVLSKAVESTIINGKKRATNKRDCGFYQSTITRLNNAWEQYKQMYMTLKRFKIDSENKTLLEKRFEELDFKCSEYQADLYEGLNQKQGQQNSESPQTTNTATQQIQLPRIQLPKFDGNYDNWRSFSDLFKSVVHDDKTLQNVQKLHYLKGCLTHDAERLLRNIPITNEDYLPAWEKLKKRYENPRILINTQVKRLLNQEKMKVESSKGLRNLTDTTEECLQQISLLGEETDSWDTLLIHILEKKLPFETIKLWEEGIGDSDNLPTLAEFIKFLQTRARVLECVSSTVGNSAVNNTNSTKCLHVSAPQKKVKCPACESGHFVLHCEKFKNMSIEERRQCILKAKLCYNCLSSKHHVNQCSNKYTCRKCSKKHNTWLHAETNPSSSTSNNTGEGTSTDNIQNFFNAQSSNSFLATAVVSTKGQNGKQVQLRCVVDSGSQVAFITEAAVKKLGLARSSSKAQISGVNNVTTAETSSQVKVTLQSCVDLQELIDANLFVIDNIAESVPTKTIKVDDKWSYLNQLQLADPQFWKAGSVDILLGADLYVQILKSGIVKGANGGPTAINTSLGWILMGGGTTCETA